MTEFEQGRIDMWEDLKRRILPVAERFIKKVETGKAKSKETYADMLSIREMFKGGALDAPKHKKEDGNRRDMRIPFKLTMTRCLT